MKRVENVVQWDGAGRFVAVIALGLDRIDASVVLLVLERLLERQEQQEEGDKVPGQELCR
jgi:hypothetical protein